MIGISENQSSTENVEGTGKNVKERGVLSMLEMSLENLVAKLPFFYVINSKLNNI